MATDLGDELEAAGRGHLRASHAERERVIGDNEKTLTKLGEQLDKTLKALSEQLGSSLPRRVASSKPDWAGTGSASKAGLRSTDLRVNSKWISKESGQVRPHLPEPCLHRDAQRRDVLAHPAEHHAALDAGQQSRGQLGGLGVRA